MTNAKLTFGPALEKTVKELEISEQLREGFKDIFEYTNQNGGIRHSKKKGDTDPDEADAGFMLVLNQATRRVVETTGK